MKKRLIFFIFGIITIIPYGFSQNLSLGELIQISGYKNWESVNSYLSNKGWIYDDSEKGDDTHYNIITWSYGKTYSEKATGWFHLYTYDGLPNKITYNYFDSKVNNSLKNNLNSYGFTLANSKIESGKISSEYKNTNYVIIFKSSQRDEFDYYDNAVISYDITITKKGGVYDKNNGVKKIYYDSGELMQEYSLIDGKTNGKLKEYTEDGILRLEIEFKNDVENGAYKEYFEIGGKLALQGNFKNGLKEGLWENFSYSEKNEKKVIQYWNYNNGIKKGKFKEIISDTLIDNDSISNGYIESNYSNGKLNGDYVLGLYITAFENISENPKETVLSYIDRTGKYIDGKKEGLWKFYNLSGTLIQEGSYVNDLREGKWVSYGWYTKKLLINYDPKDTSNIQEINTYKNGVLNGESVEYFEYEKIEVPCDENDDKNLVCIKYIKVNNKTIMNFLNGLSDGPCQEIDSKGIVKRKYNLKKGKANGYYEERDSLGNVIAFGKYIMGEKDSIWIKKYKNGICEYVSYNDGEKNGVFVQNDINGNTLIKGLFKNNLKDGKWIYFTNGMIASIKNYYNDELQGVSEFYAEGVLTTEIEFNNSEIQKISYYSDNTLSQERELIKKIKNYYFIRITDFKEDTTEAQDYKVYCNEFPNDSIINTEGVKEGLYTVMENNNILIEGDYINDKKEYSWHYYLPQNVIRNTTYSNGEVNSTLEYYTIIGNEKLSNYFSGTLKIYYPNNIIKEEINIKEGHREGNTIYYDIKGKKIKKEKYEKGILEN